MHKRNGGVRAISLDFRTHFLYHTVMKELTCDELNVVYEDNHIIVVVKPQNVPSCPDGTGDKDMLTLVKEYLIKKYDKKGDAFVGLVHRLDRPTGGVMVFAKTSKAASRLSESIKAASHSSEGFKNEEFEKKYLTVVVGKPRENSVVGLKNYLLKDAAKNIVYNVPMATEGAKCAVLDYTVIASNDDLSLLSVRLHTGRAHQIRVQMSVLGTPVFGDQKYGQGKSPVGYNLALWATELRLIHPTTKETLVFRVYPPTDAVPWKYFDINRYLAVSIKNNY